MAQATKNARKQSTKKMEVTELTSAVEVKETVNADTSQVEAENEQQVKIGGRRGRQMSAERIAEKLTQIETKLSRLDEERNKLQEKKTRLEQMAGQAPSAELVALRSELRQALKNPIPDLASIQSIQDRIKAYQVVVSA